MAVSTVHHFVVEPLKGVGPIRFGMHKDEVSRVFTYVYASFFKGPDSKVRADHCEVVGLIIHYDGAKWTKMDSGTKNALPRVHGSGAGDVWFSGYHGTMVHWDGKALATESAAYDRGLYGVYVRGAGDVWTVGQAAEVEHRDAKGWTRVIGGDYSPQNAIWGVDATNFWVVGPGQLLHYNGASWQEETSTQTILGLSAIDGTGPKDVWAVG